MNKDVYEKILFMLNKIARNTGELEDDSIYNLESQFNIYITEEEVSQLRNREIWIWIIKPFNIDDYENEKRRLDLKDLSYPIDNLTKKQQLNGKYYIKYPERIPYYSVNDNLLGDLLRMCQVCEGLTGQEWEVIKKTSQWKDAEIQIARELIAKKIYREVSRKK